MNNLKLYLERKREREREREREKECVLSSLHADHKLIFVLESKLLKKDTCELKWHF